MDEGQSSKLLYAALSYAARGWYVFPCDPRGKEPVATGGHHSDGTPKRLRFSQAATNDPEAVCALWTRWGMDCNIGLACGPSGLIVVDIDPRNSGDETWHEVRRRHSVNDDTVTSLTGGGGTHYLYCVNGADPAQLRGELGPGVDIKKAGGYIIAPPSVHPDTGQTYEWEISGHPDDMQPIPLPPSLLYLLKQDNVTKPAEPIGEHIREGERNTTLASLAGSMRRRGASEAAILAALLQENTARCDPPLDASEVRGIAHSIARYEPAPILIMPDGRPENPLLRHGPEDEGNAQTVAELHGGEFLYTPELGWLHWTGTHWSPNGAELTLDRAVTEILIARRVAAVEAEKESIVKTAKPSAYRRRGCIAQLKSIVAASMTEFDADPDLLNVANGVLDISTQTLTPHNPAQRFSYCCPGRFDPKADFSEWEWFITTALAGDLDLVRYVQEALGYTLTGHTREECLFYVHGPARAGKGTLTETMIAAWGRPIADEVSFATFTADRTGDTQSFDLAGLKPCRFITASETGKYTQLNTEVIKRITGGNYIRAAHKHKPLFTYRPQFKLWLTSNYPVRADVDDDAAWCRLRVIEFPRSFAGREDKLLKARLKHPDNLTAALTWAAIGAVVWYGTQTGLETPNQVQSATDGARQALDYVGQWLD